MAVNDQSNKPKTSQERQSAVSRFNAQFQAPISRNQSGDALNKFSAAFGEVLKKIPMQGALEHKLLPLDTTDVNGCIQLLTFYKERAGKVAYYTLLLEATLQSDLQDRVIPASLDTPEMRLPTTTDELYTPQLDAYVRRRLSDVNKIGAENIGNAGASVIYRELVPDAELHAEELHTILWRACNAIQDMFDDLENAKRFNLAEFRDDGRFTGHLDFNPGLAKSTSCLPIRRDVMVAVEMSDGTTQYDPTEFTRHNVQLARVGAYIDPMYVGPNSQVNPLAVAMGYPVATQVYKPMLYITDMTTCTNKISMEMFLLGLGEFSQLAQNNNWVNMLRQVYGGNDTISKLRSFKAYNIELASAVKSPDEKDFNLLLETNKIMYNSPNYVLLCQRLSDLSWLEDLFVQAGSGDKDCQNAIINAANNLTNNHFGQFFSGNEICRTLNDRHVVGVWNCNDELRPLSDIDQRAMWNYCGETDPKTAMDYADTFNTESGVSVQIRLARRIEILRRAFGGAVKIKGYAIPVMLHPDFLIALYNGVRKAGANIQYDTSTSMLGTASRAQTGMLGYGVDPSKLSMATGFSGMNQMFSNTFFGGNGVSWR